MSSADTLGTVRPLPPRVEPPTRPLGLLASLRAARRNVLEIIPALAYVQPIVSGRLGSRWHMVQDPAALGRIFLDNVENYPKAEVMLRMLRPAVGRSLFTLEGEEWRFQRRAVAPVFARRRVHDLAPAMTRTAERASARIAAAGGPVEITSEMVTATFDVICDVALSGREHFDAAAYSAAIVRYFQTIGRASLLDFLQLPAWMPRPAELAGRRAVRTMHRMVARAIEDRRRQVTAPADDLLDHVLRAEDPETGRRMTPDELLHNMQFFIVAGHETTALALSWSLLLLALHPEIQAAARAEARAVLGSAPAGPDHTARMPLVRQVLDEALRLYPPVAFLARTARGPDTLAGREIRRGDVIFLPIWALHRHRLWWSEPDRFEPENFAPSRAKDRDRFLHLPFGAGPRVCVGAEFAMMQAQIILSTLLARFEFRLAAGHELPQPVMTMTLRPEGGVWLTATPR